MSGVYDVLVQKEIKSNEEKIYDLKTIYYEDDKIENMLCSLLKNKWKVKPTFQEHIQHLQTNQSRGKNYPLLLPEYYEFLTQHLAEIDAIFKKFDHEKPFTLSYFGLETLQNKYLLKTHDGYQENLEFFWMRIAAFIHQGDWPSVSNMYFHLKKGDYTHATPTLFNAGTRCSQMASCFLLGVADNLESIFQSIADCAKVSKFAGGIGLHISDIRPSNSYIYGTNGTSNGIIPMLKVYNDTARYIDQGGGKRNGAFAIYLEPWHADVFDFLNLKKNIGSDEIRARDLFYSLWVPDVFMKCVEENKPWYLMNPAECVGLTDAWGDRFTELYYSYVEKGMFLKEISARELWIEIVKIQIETGTPYMMFKDNCNRLSNQQNLGTIRSSNLCTEIIQYSSDKEYAVCNLASVALPRCLKENAQLTKLEKVIVLGKENCSYCKLLLHFLKNREIPYSYEQNIQLEDDRLKIKTFPNIYVITKGSNDKQFVGGFTDMWDKYLTPQFDFDKLGQLVKDLVRNLNHVIDRNMYPLEKMKTNLIHRPLGIGVQGLADCFMELLLPYDHKRSRQLNMNIFECMYYHALEQSMELAKSDGKPYDSYAGSPLSQGKFHFELYEDADKWKSSYKFMYDWDSLRGKIKTHGVKNSLFIAPMPTASTSQILNNTESFECLMSNFFLRRTQNGEFYVMNRNMQKILKGIDLWDKDMHQRLIYDKGSVQRNSRIPNFLKEIYRTVWEIPQKHCIEMASERQRFIDQSQSMNIYLTDPSIEHVTKILFHGWRNKLKTGCYYVRTRSLSSTQNFSLDATTEKTYDCENCSA
jgi:ribonucleoside-diphosphate reductase alpha subunit